MWNEGGLRSGTPALLNQAFLQAPACSVQMRGVHITLRMRLECRIVRRGAARHSSSDEVHEVLNEVVVDRGANPYLAKIECWERDTLITKVGPCAQHCRRHGGLLLRIGGVPGDRACGMRPCCGEVSATVKVCYRERACSYSHQLLPAMSHARSRPMP